MPKRKRDDKEYMDHIKKKMKKLERKLKKHSRKYSTSSDSENSVQLSNDPKDDNIESENVENEELREPSVSPVASLPAVLDQSPDKDHVTAPEEALPPPRTEGVSSNDNGPSTETDDFMLEILGKDPSKTIAFGKDIQKDLAIRFNFIATTGLTKELRKELIDAHLTPDNCRMIAAPSLNPEIKAAVTEQVIKRDKAMETKQKQISSAIACLSDAITLLLEKETKDPSILRMLIDTGRLICDSQHNESVTRRNFVMAVLKKDLKDQMLLTKIDSFLFGQELAETLKTAKAINKTGADLKATTPINSNASKPKPPPPKKNLNWKAPTQNRRQQPPGPSKTKESAHPRQQHAPPSRASRQNFSRGRR